MYRYIALVLIFFTSCITMDVAPSAELKFTNKSNLTVCYRTSGYESTNKNIHDLMKYESEPGRDILCVQPKETVMINVSKDFFDYVPKCYVFLYNKQDIGKYQLDNNITEDEILAVYKFSKADLDAMDWHLVYDGK